MPIINLHKEHPLDDGRQSEKALMVRHGVQRLFLRLGIPVLSELPLADGRRADLVGITRKGEVIIVMLRFSRVAARRLTRAELEGFDLADDNDEKAD